MKKRTNAPLVMHGIEQIRVYAAEARARGQSIGLVPTMGSLHEGHLSLIRRAVAENDRTIVSIFVNPIQFDDKDDLALYPRSLSDDADMSFETGADVVFAPDAGQMYPEGFSTYIDITGITDRLCGASRQAHFRGVLTVVGKLFGICTPDRAYFGEKDAQQLAIVKKMVNELCIPVTVIGCPTVREDDGLAKSSRNARLSADERAAASCLFRAISEAKQYFDGGEKDTNGLKAVMRTIIEKQALARIDYVEIADPLTFESVSAARAGDLMLLAVYIGKTRLIDNGRF